MAPFVLPGFTEPLDFVSRAARTEHDPYSRFPKITDIPSAGSGRNMFPNALFDENEVNRARFGLTTIRELLMLRFMNEVTDKQGWHFKVNDDSIVEKWKHEALQQANFTETMASYCIEELRWRAGEFAKTGFTFVFNGDVVKSDTAVSADLKSRLQAAVQSLENIPKEQKDYHPNSNEQVLDLVHPSLFPLVFGTSRILRDEVIGLNDCMSRCGTGEVVPVPPNISRQYFSTLYSTNFQWLPCDVRLSVGTVGDDFPVKCTITSYINNLRPDRHKDLYAVIEDVIAAAIPLWNETLLADEDKRREPRISYKRVIYNPHPDTLSHGQRSCVAYGRWLRRIRMENLTIPEPEDFHPPKKLKTMPIPSLPFVDRFATTGLQVIVKLATIELTPDKSSYAGGVWHVEGQLNEHICATALYYYSSDNITESRLAFRQMSHEDVEYEQHDSTFLEPVFGCRNEEPAVQDVGSVFCKEGRLLTFPNTLQHRVLPFELLDKSKPGHRKILALFLVDPNLHIISTSSVPPQSQDWWSDAVRERGGIGGLSDDLVDRVAAMFDFPLSMDKAKSLRLELMEERKVFETRALAKFEDEKFSLCEH
jgi:Protein of unknown function (DUF4246)